eukprot:SAG22_NODE_2917_length_2106_cov_2.485301_1_plen_587_part_01
MVAAGPRRSPRRLGAAPVLLPRAAGIQLLLRAPPPRRRRNGGPPWPPPAAGSWSASETNVTATATATTEVLAVMDVATAAPMAPVVSNATETTNATATVVVAEAAAVNMTSSDKDELPSADKGFISDIFGTEPAPEPAAEPTAADDDTATTAAELARLQAVATTGVITTAAPAAVATTGVVSIDLDDSSWSATTATPAPDTGVAANATAEVLAVMAAATAAPTIQVVSTLVFADDMHEAPATSNATATVVVAEAAAVNMTSSDKDELTSANKGFISDVFATETTPTIPAYFQAVVNATEAAAEPAAAATDTATTAAPVAMLAAVETTAAPVVVSTNMSADFFGTKPADEPAAEPALGPGDTVTTAAPVDESVATTEAPVETDTEPATEMAFTDKDLVAAVIGGSVTSDAEAMAMPSSIETTAEPTDAMAGSSDPEAVAMLARIETTDAPAATVDNLTAVDNVTAPSAGKNFVTELLGFTNETKMEEKKAAIGVMVAEFNASMAAVPAPVEPLAVAATPAAILDANATAPLAAAAPTTPLEADETTASANATITATVLPRSQKAWFGAAPAPAPEPVEAVPPPAADAP